MGTLIQVGSRVLGAAMIQYCLRRMCLALLYGLMSVIDGCIWRSARSSSHHWLDLLLVACFACLIMRPGMPSCAGCRIVCKIWKKGRFCRRLLNLGPNGQHKYVCGQAKRNIGNVRSVATRSRQNALKTVDGKMPLLSPSSPSVNLSV